MIASSAKILFSFRICQSMLCGDRYVTKTGVWRCVGEFGGFALTSLDFSTLKGVISPFKHYFIYIC